jgi:hypothetical protein
MGYVSRQPAQEENNQLAHQVTTSKSYYVFAKAGTKICAV